MADLLYDYGLDEWRDWVTGTYTWLALKSDYTPTRTHRYVADVAASEIAGTGYHRSPLASATRTVDTLLHRVTYDCADPDFGSPIASAGTIGWVVVAKVVTSDADSILLSLFDIPDFDSDGGPFSPVVGANGAHYIDQG